MNEEINSNTEPVSSGMEPIATEVMSLKPKKNNFWKFMIAFVAIILLVFGGYWLWNNRLSPEAKESREMQANYDRAIAHQQQFEEAMRNDTYGGKTPEETLQLLIEALRKDDIELAYQYFILEEDGNRDPKWKEGLRRVRSEGRLSQLVDLLSRTIPDPAARISDDYFVFATRDKDGTVLVDIDLKFNTYSGVWKIERL